jgi:hypothetical protein
MGREGEPEASPRETVTGAAQAGAIVSRCP